MTILSHLVSTSMHVSMHMRLVLSPICCILTGFGQGFWQWEHWSRWTQCTSICLHLWNGSWPAKWPSRIL